MYILGRVTGGLESWPGEGIVKRCYGQQLRDRAKNVARCQGLFRKPNSTGCPEYVQLGVYTRVDMERTFVSF